MSNTEFKFPDELDKKAETTEDELDIQIVDDTPEADRGRQPMPPEVVKELEDEDLGEYSEKVALRMKQMKKVWHDERREKEAATRREQEATDLAKTLLEENRGLKKRMGAGEKVFISEVTKAAETELNIAREKLRAAIQEGDAEAIATQTEAVADAKARVRETSQLRPSLQEDEEGVKHSTQTQPAAAPVAEDPRAKAWQASNKWFGDDEEMTALALGLHAKLVKSGVVASSDEYYDQINKTMRKRFPEHFKDENPEKPDESKDPTPRQQEKPAQTRRPATPVAPATRTTAPRQVRLTSSQVELAKRLGVSNEAYARAVLKLEVQEKQNG